MKTILGLTLAVAIFTASLPATSHHSFPGVYNTGEMLFLEGKVTEFLFRNPHSFLFLEVEAEDGSTENWHLELAPAWALMRFGVVKDFIKVDDELLVACNPARDGTTSCGIGSKTGFYRHSDGYLMGKDPRKEIAKLKEEQGG
jgi:hypothetical protein